MTQKSAHNTISPSLYSVWPIDPVLTVAREQTTSRQYRLAMKLRLLPPLLCNHPQPPHLTAAARALPRNGPAYGSAGASCIICTVFWSTVPDSARKLSAATCTAAHCCSLHPASLRACRKQDAPLAAQMEWGQDSIEGEEKKQGKGAANTTLSYASATTSSRRTHTQSCA